MDLASDIESNQKRKGMGGCEASFFYVLFQQSGNIKWLFEYDVMKRYFY